MAYARLLTPAAIGPVTLRNRVMWASHATNYAEESGEVSDTQVRYFARRANGGVGMVVSELVQVATEIDPLRVTHRSLRADDERFVPGLERLVQAVHDQGAKIGVQMSPGAGTQALGGPWRADAEVRAASPSGVLALGVHEHAMNPRVLTIGEIQRIVELFGQSTANVRAAGFDLIEIHAHGGYLIHEFLSPYFNRRTDAYGGTLDNRCRLLLEIVQAVKQAAGPQIAISVKWSVQDWLPGGWDVEQSLALVRKLTAAGVDALGVSSGVHGSRFPAAPPYFYPLGTFLPFVEPVRGATKLPLYTSGRLDDPQLCERILSERRLDFVQVCRGLIADPDWVRKIAEHRTQDIRPCLACNHCRNQLVLRNPVTCTVNPEAGRERDGDGLAAPRARRKVVIAGGGPAGMEAARTAAQQGHAVILCEKHGRLGGLLSVAGIHNERIEAYQRWLQAELRQLPVDIRLDTEVTPELVERLQPDYVILAIGGAIARPAIPGVDGHNVFGVSDVLGLIRGDRINGGALLRILMPLAGRLVTPSIIRRLLRTNFLIGREVVVIGGQFAGCSLALLLAHMDKRVTLIEESERYGRELESNTRAALDHELESGRVKMLTNARAAEITAKGVRVAHADGNTRFIQAATVLLAPDLLPGGGDLGSRIAHICKVRTIGDARAFERIPNAVAEGHAAALEIA